jgi:tetratricopeptide (TPR) repeat protein
MSAILKEAPPPLEGAHVPPDLGLIILRCLEKDPGQRFQSASDLAFAIRSLSTISTAVHPDTKPLGRRKSMSYAALALSVAALAAAGIYWLPPKAKPAPIPPASPAAPAKPPAAPPPSELVSGAPQPQTKAIERTAKPVPSQESPAGETETTGSRAASLVAQGQQLSNEGKYQEAVASFSEALLRRPRMIAAFLGRGNAYSALGQFDHAADDFTHALDIQPGMALAHDSRGKILMRQGQLDRALQDFNEAIRLKPDLAIAYSNRGHLYNQKGEYQLALQDFDQAIRLKPDAVNAYEGRAQARLRSGDRAGAKADRKQAAQLRR